LNGNYQCPPENNNDQLYDPNYKQQPSSAFVTDEYTMQVQSNVYQWLLWQPSYRYYVSSPMQQKKSVTLYAWTRATSYWDITCDWDGTMPRDTAWQYYHQEFSNPTMTYMAATCASALMWISIIYFGCLMLALAAGFKGGIGAIAGIYLLLGMCARICWFVTLPIVYHRVNESWFTASANL
jgi:hypothetical protein